MDLSKISKGGQIFAGAGLVYFIASFLNWFSFDVPGFPEAGIAATSVDASGWDVGFLWCGLWALALLAGAVMLVLPAFGVSVPKLPAVGYLAAAGLGALFTLLKLLIGESDPWERSIGLYLAVIAVGAAVFGAFLMFQESGGQLSDLTNPDKLKASFGGGSSPAAPGMTPPPPPPGMTPPPPPPPAPGTPPPPPPPPMG
jgi:hypothetical protein